MLSKDILKSIVQIYTIKPCRSRERRGGTSVGFIISDDGIIATTEHAVSNFTEHGVGDFIEIVFFNGDIGVAEIDPFWLSRSYDVALLRLARQSSGILKALRLGRSDETIGHSVTVPTMLLHNHQTTAFFKCTVVGRPVLQNRTTLQLRPDTENIGIPSGAPVMDDISGMIIGMVNSVYQPVSTGRSKALLLAASSETLDQIYHQGTGKSLMDKKGIITQVSILFLSADPTNASRLRLGKEFAEINEQLRLAKNRDKFKLELPQLSLRPKDISGALLNTQPKIVHFSGHGTSMGALCFENEMGEIQLVQPDAIAALFEQFANQVHCVLLNACYSEIQAKAIAEHVEYVIGMNQEIGDKAAIAFAIGFYQALGAGRTIEDAYKLGCVQIRLQSISENLTPVLIKRGPAQP